MSNLWEPLEKPPPPKSVSGLSNLASKINKILICNLAKDQGKIYGLTKDRELYDRSPNRPNINCFSDLRSPSKLSRDLEAYENGLEIIETDEESDNFFSSDSERNSETFYETANDEPNPFKIGKESKALGLSYKTSQIESSAWESPPTVKRKSSVETDISKKTSNELYLNNYFQVVKVLKQSRVSRLNSSGVLETEILSPHFKIQKTTKPEENFRGKVLLESNSKNISKSSKNCHVPLKVWKKNEKSSFTALNKNKTFFVEGSAMMPSNSSFEESIMLRGPLTMTSTTEAVSPVTLRSDWSRVARLLLLTALSVTGSVGNVFMISAVMIEDHLKKRGNSFLVNIALADILITGLVIPASTVVILADLTDAKVVVCNFQWFLALVSCLVSVLTISATAMENYARLCMSPACYSTLTPCKITAIIILIWLTSCTAVTVQTVLRLGPDYCERTSQGLLPYQITIGVLLVFIPATLACACFSLITFRVRTFKSIPTFRPPVTFTFDYELMKSNVYGFIFFLVFWLPFGMTLALGSIQTISQRVFYSFAWLALSKSCFLNFLYCITNRHFRNAYVNLFHYCCCKTTVSFSRRSREPVRPTGDVRVHIIPGYNMYSYTSPQRSREVTKTMCKRVGTSASCRPTSSRPNGRDVYEL